MAWEITITDGTAITGAYAPDGTFYVVDRTEDDDVQVGAFHPCGARNVTFVSGEDPVTVYAPNGSFNLFDATLDPTDKIYHPCGALYSITVTDETEE